MGLKCLSVAVLFLVLVTSCGEHKSPDANRFDPKLESVKRESNGRNCLVSTAPFNLPSGTKLPIILKQKLDYLYEGRFGSGTTVYGTNLGGPEMEAWNVATGNSLFVLGYSNVTGRIFSPDLHWLTSIVSSVAQDPDNGKVFVEDAQSGKKMKTLIDGRAFDVAGWSSDGCFLAGMTWPYPQMPIGAIWDSTTGDIVQTFDPYPHGRFQADSRVGLTSDGKKFIGRTNDWVILAWDAFTGKTLWHSQPKSAHNYDFSLAPTGSIAALPILGGVIVISLNDGSVLYELQGSKCFPQSVPHLSFSPDSRFLATIDGTHTCIWNMGSGNVEWSSSATRIRFSPDATLAIVIEDKMVRVFRTTDWSLVGEVAPLAESQLVDAKIDGTNRYLLTSQYKSGAGEHGTLIIQSVPR